ncbi:hypothetical protein Metev_1598 [Methanohalobium evestigatum Z-7303]|uniref:Uncharacterized protein n=1 Tax=Methanohalobium evestigatum (strain ATCC BAA-1072 / DSM 3721 / NBRC 107634 / OCM 161 / Z-7303) TaxID=644295 RepID=D7EAS6_METEZ|nr:hypothetical protein [Methanohalobium evestigatum]ADI74443.1 hypothetical protein Metev_1598 [Methanohalobium evestigatum Z-7303]
MCKIEKLGYSRYNKQRYCRECIIYNQLGKCEYLKWCESDNQENNNMPKSNVYNLESSKSLLQDWDSCQPNYLNVGH